MRSVEKVPIVVLNGIVVVAAVGYGAIAALAGPPGALSFTTLVILGVVCIPHLVAAWAVLGHRSGYRAGVALALNVAWVASLVAVGGVAATGIAGLAALLFLVVPGLAVACLNAAACAWLLFSKRMAA